MAQVRRAKPAILRSIAYMYLMLDSGAGVLSIEKHGSVGSWYLPLQGAAFPMLESSQAPESSVSICASPDAFQIAIEQLRVQVESIELRILTSFTKVVVGGEQEVSAVGEIVSVLEHIRVQIAGCQTQREEALRDVELYRRELGELEEIARGDSAAYNYSALSLLGERSLILQSDMSSHTDSSVHRAAEMHFSVVRAAKQVAACEQRQALSRTLPSSEYLPDAGADACRASRDTLLRMYRIAYSHINSLLEMALKISIDDICWFAAFEMYDERRAPLDRRVEEARRQICDGAREGESARVEAQLMQTRMRAMLESFTVSCGDVAWQRYVTAVNSLVAMATTQPMIPVALCSNDTSFTTPYQASLLEEGALRMTHNSRAEELEQHIASARQEHHLGGKVLLF